MMIALLKILPTRIKTLHLFRYSGFLLVVLMTCAGPAMAVKQNVLVLHSYHEGYPWTDQINGGIMEVLGRSTGLEVFVEYMDAIRFSSNEHIAVLEKVYNYRYNNIELKLIVVADDDAFDFILQREPLFAREVPVVFAGVDNFSPERIAHRNNIWGVEAKPSMAETIEVALRLSPLAEKFAVIAGNRLTEQIFFDQFLQCQEMIPEDIELIALYQKEPDELKEALEKLGQNDIVLYLSWLQTPSGKHFSVAESMEWIRQATPARIFAIRDFVLPLGAIGGKMIDPYSHGYAAASMAVDFLQKNIKPQKLLASSEINRYIFNEKALFEYGISLKDLPDNVIMVNRTSQSLVEYWESLSKQGVFGYDFFENHGVVMLIVDPFSGTILDANRAAVNFYGYPDLIGRAISELNTFSEEQIQAEMMNAQRMNRNFFDFQHRLRDESLRNVRVYSYPVEHHGLQVLFSVVVDRTDEVNTMNRLNRTYVSIIIISVLGLLTMLLLLVQLVKSLKERKQVQYRLEESEKRFRELFNHVMDVVFSCDASGRILQVNPVITELLGDKKVLGETVWDLLPQGEQIKWKSYIQKAIEKGNRRFSLETRIFNYRAEMVYLEINGFIKYDIHSQKVKEIFGIARNITDHKHMSRMVLKASIEAQESERKRFAFEIHDGIGPLLSGMKMYLQQDTLAQNMNPRQIKILNFCRQILDDAIAQTRLISSKLSPGLLNDFGLEKALRSYVSRLEMIEHCSLELEIDDGLDLLDKNTGLNIYRIATELISNSLKHSRATRIWINIQMPNDMITLSFGDNGQGFDAEKLLGNTTQKGMGLYNIISRVRILDGNIVFDQPSAGGVRVEIEIPLKRNEG